MTMYAYARVSTQRQSIERQLTNIARAYPEIEDRNIYREKYTGTKIDERAQFQKLLKRCAPGDVIVFDSVSRFSRQADEGFELYEDLFNRGIDLVFIKEPYINTTNYREAMNARLPEVDDDCLRPLMEGLAKTLLLLAQKQFKQAFEQSEKEVQDLRNRTREGLAQPAVRAKIEAAAQRKTGKTLVTQKSLDAKRMLKKVSKDFDGNLSDAEAMKVLGVARNTFYKYKRELKAEDEAEKE